jgi:hypothetical protein
MPRARADFWSGIGMWSSFLACGKRRANGRAQVRFPLLELDRRRGYGPGRHLLGHPS